MTRPNRRSPGPRAYSGALSILRAFSSRQPELSGPEVAAKFGYSVPTAYRLLRALEAEQFLVFDRVTHRYRPGPEILRLSGAMLHRDDVVAKTQESLVRPRPGHRSVKRPVEHVPETGQEGQPDDSAHDHRHGPHDDGLVNRRMPTGWIAISRPSTRTKEFGLCHVRPTMCHNPNTRLFGQDHRHVSHS